MRVLKYKVIFYTYDHRLSEVKRWMKKGFSAWNNPMINAHLRKHGCQTLQFVETLVGIIIFLLFLLFIVYCFFILHYIHFHFKKIHTWFIDELFLPSQKCIQMNQNSQFLHLLRSTRVYLSNKYFNTSISKNLSIKIFRERTTIWQSILT